MIRIQLINVPEMRLVTQLFAIAPSPMENIQFTFLLDCNVLEPIASISVVLRSQDYVRNSPFYPYSWWFRKTLEVH